MKVRGWETDGMMKQRKKNSPEKMKGIIKNPFLGSVQHAHVQHALFAKLVATIYNVLARKQASVMSQFQIVVVKH